MLNEAPEPVFREFGGEEDAEPEVTEIESLCMNCHANKKVFWATRAKQRAAARQHAAAAHAHPVLQERGADVVLVRGVRLPEQRDPARRQLRGEGRRLAPVRGVPRGSEPAGGEERLHQRQDTRPGLRDTCQEPERRGDDHRRYRVARHPRPVAGPGAAARGAPARGAAAAGGDRQAERAAGRPAALDHRANGHQRQHVPGEPRGATTRPARLVRVLRALRGAGPRARHLQPRVRGGVGRRSRVEGEREGVAGPRTAPAGAGRRGRHALRAAGRRRGAGVPHQLPRLRLALRHQHEDDQHPALQGGGHHEHHLRVLRTPHQRGEVGRRHRGPGRALRAARGRHRRLLARRAQVGDVQHGDPRAGPGGGRARAGRPLHDGRGSHQRHGGAAARLPRRHRRRARRQPVPAPRLRGPRGGGAAWRARRHAGAGRPGRQLLRAEPGRRPQPARRRPEDHALRANLRAERGARHQRHAHGGLPPAPGRLAPWLLPRERRSSLVDRHTPRNTKDGARRRPRRFRTSCCTKKLIVVKLFILLVLQGS